MTQAALDRATGALVGLALGDALGMPTQLLTRDEVVARYGPVLTRFHAAAPDHPVCAGLAAGTVTDDTEQAMLLARLLIEGGGRVDPIAWAAALGEWEAVMVARGSADLLGPSTRAALAAVAAGVPPADAGRTGTTNGAAMRIAAVGVAVDVTDGKSGVARLVERVTEVSQVTHGTDVALAGAVAVAAAVSRGVAGGDVGAAIDAAVSVAPQGAHRGHPTGSQPLAGLIEAARDQAAGLDGAAVATLVADRIGTSLQTAESVPAAFAVLAACPEDPWLACRVAASVGGDSDTIAAMVGAVAGACHGVGAFPRTARDLVEQRNHLQVGRLAAGLLALRGGR